MQHARLSRWTVVFLLAGLALPGLAGCQTRGSAADNIPTPPRNPHPAHAIKITGRLPASFDLQLRAVWEIGTHSPECLVDRPFWNGGGDRAHGVDIPVQRRGDRYEAELSIDRFLPGSCQWHFVGAGAVIANRARGAVATVPAVTARFMHDPASVAKLPRNADATPVEIHCGTVPQDLQHDGLAPFGCNWSVDPDHKTIQWIQPETREIQIDIFDTDDEALSPRKADQ